MKFYFPSKGFLFLESNDSEDLSDIIAAVDSNSQSTSSERVPLSKNNMKSLPLMLDNNNGDERIKNTQADTNRASTCCMFCFYFLNYPNSVNYYSGR
jgi:hypothetical protein